MSRGWQRWSLKIRLTLWYATATAIVLAVFAWVTYEVVEHRLAGELDRQLRIDFDLIEAQLDADVSGKVLWLVHGAHGDEGFARLSAWFEVWSEDKAVLLASLGGYFIARGSLQPIASMVGQARKITSESLGERLPVRNPYDELGQLAAVFNQTLERLERSFGELKRFTADASHELRTPLTALRTVGEVALAQRNSPVSFRETIGSMLEEAQRLNDLIESLLALARMEGGKVAITREWIILVDLASDVRESLNVLALESHQTITVMGDSGLTTAADRLLLRQALMNIVHNAVRYAPPHTTITVRASRGQGFDTLEVVDQGPGIALEHVPKIFDRFYRVESSRSRTGGGTGLGLAIAKWSVECQGGRIEVQSELGKGSTFRILFPS